MSDEPPERINTTPDQRQKIEGGITGKGFKKGDPRINRKGRPKSFDQLRALAQQIAHERIKEGSAVTAAVAILRKLALDNPERFIEIAFGKVPDEQRHSGSIDIHDWHSEAIKAIRDGVLTPAMLRDGLRLNDDEISALYREAGIKQLIEGDG